MANIPAPTHPADAAVLLETRLENRDGGSWLTGLCSFCWERVGFRDLAEGQTLVRCKNGHALRIIARNPCARSQSAQWAGMFALDQTTDR